MEGTDSTVANGPRWSHRIQILVGCLVAILIAGALCLRYDWWFQSNVNNGHRLLLGVYGGVLLLVLLITWFVILIRNRYPKNRRLGWPNLLTPGILIVGVVLFLFPGPTEFSDARPEMQRVATQMLNEPSPERRLDVRIGGLDFNQVYKHQSSIIFSSADSFLTYGSGWIYSPSEVPSRFGPDSLHDLGGNWYSYERND